MLFFKKKQGRVSPNESNFKAYYPGPAGASSSSLILMVSGNADSPSKEIKIKYELHRRDELGPRPVSGREIKFPFSRGGIRAIHASFTTRVRRPEGAIKRFDASRFDWKGKECFF